MDLLQRLWEQLRHLVLNMSASQRVSLAILGASALISLTMLVLMSGGGHMEKLYYSRLDPDDAAEITKFMNEKGYKHKYEDGFVYVSKNDKDMIVLALGEEGMSLDGKDPYEYLHKPNITDTDKTRMLKHLHAVERNLAKIIAKIKVVQKADVTITQEEGSPYLFDNEEPAKAAVLVQLGFGKQLGSTQVLSIASLVANSIKNMNRENVAISDTTGYIYKVPDDLMTGIEDRLTSTKQHEDHLVEKVENALAFLPPAQVRVTANVSLNMKYIKENTHDVIGDGTEVRDREKRKESEESSKPPTLPVGSTTEDRNAGDRFTRTFKKDFTEDIGQVQDWDKLDRFVESHPDAIEKKSISIVVPWELAALKKGEAEINESETEANLNANLQEWRELAMGATGIGETKDVVIHAVTFRLSEDAQMEPGAVSQLLDFVNENWYKGAILGFLAVAFGMVYVTLKRALPDLTVREEEFAVEEEYAGLPEVVLGAEELKVERMKEKIQERISEDPEGLSDMLIRWSKKG